MHKSVEPERMQPNVLRKSVGIVVREHTTSKACDDQEMLLLTGGR